MRLVDYAPPEYFSWKFGKHFVSYWHIVHRRERLLIDRPSSLGSSVPGILSMDRISQPVVYRY